MVRVKFRYFLVEVMGNYFGDGTQLQASFASKKVYYSIINAVGELFGDYGVGSLSLGFNVKIINPLTRIVYVKARRGPHRLLAAAFPFVSKINWKPCSIRTLHTSGTLSSCNKFLRKHSHQQLVQLLKKCSTDEQRSSVQKSIKSCLKKLKNVIED